MLIDVAPGPWLLSSPHPDLATHRGRFGPLPMLSADQLADLTSRHDVLGRGGAGFPFGVKLRAVAAGRARRRHLVVNVSEGEPASAKDVALAATSPHLVLDGAAMAAAALGVRTVHLVVPQEHPFVTHALNAAISEREADVGRSVRWRLHQATPRFVAGESSAVIELIEGRANLPVTSWQRAAVKGLHGQPTLLCNAETFAQVAALVLAGDQVPGTADEPGTRLLSVTRGHRIHVQEVAHGTPWSSVLSRAELNGPVLVGGYHGQWAAPGALNDAFVSAASMRAHGLALGAGIVLPLPEGSCGLTYSVQVAQYLADQSAGRCGPCVNGLPALAVAFADLAAGRQGADVDALFDLVHGRGACSHPDGTVRLVSSACTVFAEEIRVHRAGRCSSSVGRFARPA